MRIINKVLLLLLLCQVLKSVTPRLRKSSWQSFMDVRDLTCTHMGQKLKYSLITSPKKVFSKASFQGTPSLAKNEISFAKVSS